MGLWSWIWDTHLHRIAQPRSWMDRPSLNNLTHLKGEGTPNDNAHAQSYEFTVMTTDPHSDVNDNNFTITFTIIANDPPYNWRRWLISPCLHLMVITWSYSATLTSDPETLSYTRALEVDGSTTIPSWLTLWSIHLLIQYCDII